MAKIKNSDTISLVKSTQKKVSKDTKKIKKKIQDGEIVLDRKAKKLSAEEKRGLIYIAHIPHGFYENEMKNYFTQFGKVTNVLVCRSSHTGNSKGYGYVEFANPDVAKIAAESMNNYLMFKKRIVAEFVPYEKRPKHLFHGMSNKPSRIATKMRRAKQFALNNKPIDEEKHQKRSTARLSRLNKKLERLQKMGIETNFKPSGAPVRIATKVSRNSSSSYYSDSEVEFKVRKPRKSAEKSKSKSNTKVEKESLVQKSISSRKNTIKESPPKKVKKTVVNEKLKKDLKSKGVTKKSKTSLPLNTTTVKKIARELIRKKGVSLLNLITPGNKTASSKKSKH